MLENCENQTGVHEPEDYVVWENYIVPSLKKYSHSLIYKPPSIKEIVHRCPVKYVV